MSRQAGGAPRATKNDVLIGIARRTNFTKEQVNEIFIAYREILDEIIDANNRPTNFELCVPYLGYLVFKHIDRYKAGGNLKCLQKNTDERLDIDMDEQWVEAYDRMLFRVDKSISKPLKEKSRAKILKQQELRDKFGQEE